MPYDPAIHHRLSIRLAGHDYAEAGAYFVTVCTAGHRCLFGRIEDQAMRLDDAGEIVEACWRAILDHFPEVQLDAFVVMPNHVHGIIWIADGGGLIGRATHASPLRDPPRASGIPRQTHGAMAGRGIPNGPQRRSVASIVGSFKSAASGAIRKALDLASGPLWQRNYYEHIIRSDVALARIRQYIAENPATWARDRENPVAANPEMKNPWVE